MKARLQGSEGSNRMRRVPYKWRVAIVFLFGLFMALLDQTIVNVALPTFAKDFRGLTHEHSMGSHRLSTEPGSVHTR